jgi:hypothetical protein
MSVDDEIKDRLQILFEKTPIQNARLFLVRLMNDGNLPVPSSDFDGPIIFAFGDEARVLETAITEICPPTLNPKLRIQQRKQVVVEPLLLNKGDYIVFKAIVAHGEYIQLKSRVVGITAIKERIEPFPNLPLSISTLILGLGTGSVGLCLLFTSNIAMYVYSFTDVELPLLVLMYFGMLVNGLMVSVIAALFFIKEYWYPLKEYLQVFRES